MQAVILAAGQGLRLRPFTETSPKALVAVNGKPLISYTLNSLPESISEIIIVVGYLGQQIIDYVGAEYNDIPVRYCWQTELLGTGDALLRTKDMLSAKFLVLNGDDLYSKKDLSELAGHSQAILAWKSNQPTEFGLDVKDETLVGFDPTSSLINCGAYLLDATFFAEPLEGITVHEHTEYSLPHTLAKLANHSKIAVVNASFWLPVGTPEQLQFANSYLQHKAI